MKSVQLNLIAEPNEANGEEFTSKNKPQVDAGTGNPPHLHIVHSLIPRSRTSERLDHVADCSKALEIIAKLHRRALDLSKQKAQTIGSVEVPSRCNIDSRAKQNCGKVPKRKSSKPTHNPHVVYEERKRQWDHQHPNANSEQRHAAIIRIAEECGV
jgi:hypothetical protein